MPMLLRFLLTRFALTLASGVLLSACCLPVEKASAQAPGPNEPLDVRPGLYEMTVVVTMRFHLTADAAAKMTPEQRSYATNFYAQAGKPQTQKTTFCAAPSDMRPSAYIFSSDGTCTRETTISSSEKFMTHLKCATGEETYNFERIDNEHFKGFIRIAAGDGSSTQEQTRDAKWLRDSCARTPPPAPATVAKGGAGGPQPPAQAPLMTARSIRQINDYFSVVVNHSTVPMTAYAVAIVHWGRSEASRHFYDERMEGGPPIKPGGTFQQLQPGIVASVSPIAAVFADGSTFGDAKQIAAIMTRRAYKLKALTTMASILCDAERRGLDKQVAIASIESSKAHEPNGDTAMDSTILADGYTDMLVQLKLKAPSRPVSMEEALRRIQVIGTPLLADSVKDPNGALYLKTDKAALSCSAAH
jgi:hypothetical protein